MSVPAKPPMSSPLLRTISSMAEPRPRVTMARFMPRAAPPAGRTGRRPALAAERADQQRRAGTASRRRRRAGRRPAPDAGERELPERQLTGVAGDDHDRQQHQAECERWSRTRPATAAAPEDDQRRERDRHDHHERPYPARPDRRQPLQEVVAEGEGLAPDHHPRDDEDEGHGIGETGRVGDEPVEDRLADAEPAPRRRRRSGTTGTLPRARPPWQEAPGWSWCSTWSWTMGAMRMAATPARAEPSAQLAVAMRSGDERE